MIYLNNFRSDLTEKAYEEKLKIVENLLKKDHHEDIHEEIIFTLGNGINAFESVPTAIYCFLRAQTEIPGIKVTFATIFPTNIFLS